VWELVYLTVASHYWGGLPIERTGTFPGRMTCGPMVEFIYVRCKKKKMLTSSSRVICATLSDCGMGDIRERSLKVYGVPHHRAFR